MHPDLARAADRYLRVADRLLPGRITGFYLVGSAALGAWRPDRSDVDFVAVLDEPLDRSGLRRLRAVHLATAGRSATGALARGRLSLPGTGNGSFVLRDQLTLPVTAIEPVASHVGQTFTAGAAFDVNPVVWTELADHGIAVRGGPPSTLGLDPEPAALRQWNLDNLDGYWRGFAAAMQAGRSPLPLARPRWLTAWGVLGAPRLHCTITTGEVVSKEAAGEHALVAFDARWHPLVEEALAYWRGEPARPGFEDRRRRYRAVGDFVAMVVDAAHGHERGCSP